MVARDNSTHTGWAGLKKPPLMDDVQFFKWKELLEKRTGMILPLERKSFLVTSLVIRMREIGYRDYQDYYNYIVSGSRGAIEWATLVDRLTVHETRFFRHPGSVQLILDEFMPAWTRAQTPPVALNVWSVGCATGEEPYTLAMAIDDCLSRQGREYYLGVTASDISRASLAVGRQAIYHRRKLADVDPGLRERYFEALDEDHLQVVSALRSRVCFTYLHVLEMDRAPLGLMHLIYCQNMLIYFDRDKRTRILDGLAARLQPGGMLVLGAGEMLGWTHPELERVDYRGTQAFRRHHNHAAVASGSGA